jgi:hypothetical protein
MLVGAMVALFSGAASVHAKMLTQKVTNFDVKTILGESDVWINGKKYKDYRIVATDVVITGTRIRTKLANFSSGGAFDRISMPLGTSSTSIRAWQT